MLSKSPCVTPVICYVIVVLSLFRVLEWFSLIPLSIFFFISSVWPLLIGASTYRNLEQLVLLLIVSAWIFRRKNHSYIAGIVLGIACLLKIWPIILLIGILTIRENKVFISGTITIIIGILISLFIFNPLIYKVYLGPIRLYENSWLNQPQNISIIGFLTKIFNGYLPYVHPLIKNVQFISILNIGLLVSAIILGLSLSFIYLHTKSMKQDGKELVEGFLISISLLIFPLMWNWNMIILILPYTIIFQILRKKPRQPFWLYILLSCGFIAMLDPDLFLNKYPLVVTSLVDMCVTICITLFALGQLVLALRLKKEQILFGELET